MEVTHLARLLRTDIDNHDTIVFHRFLDNSLALRRTACESATLNMQHAPHDMPHTSTGH
jgi:hypothetical protein